MKRIIAMLLAAVMLLALVACGKDNTADTNTPDEAPTTVAGILRADFMERITANPEMTAQEMADALLTNSVIQFAGASMPVEQGMLMGFGETEIKGFKEGVMFAPMIGAIPFIGYVFVLEDGTDAAAFEETLKTSADLRWNICTEAEEALSAVSGNTVFFVMSPLSFEEEEVPEEEFVEEWLDEEVIAD